MIQPRLQINGEIKERVRVAGNINGAIKGIETEDATITEKDVRIGEKAYAKGEEIVGTLDESKEFDFMARNIEYIAGGATGPIGEVTFEEEDLIMLKGAKVLMNLPQPMLSDALKIKSENIMVGEEILDIKGNATSDATATSNSLIEGQTAYVNGKKITGTIKEYDGAFSGSGIIV